MAGSNRVRAIALASLLGATACNPSASPLPAESAAPTGDVVSQVLAQGADAQFFGPWSPRPFSLAPIVLVKMDAACRAGMVPFPVGLQMVVVDARGAGVAQLYYAGANGGLATCNDVALLRNGQVQQLGGGSTQNANGQAPRVLGPVELELTDQSSSGDQANVIASYLAGRAGSGIANVVLATREGPVAQATLHNGWFALWLDRALPNGWTLRGFSASGAEVATLGGA